REPVAFFVLARDRSRAAGLVDDEVEETIVDDAEVAAIGELIRELAKERMRRAIIREHVQRHARALLVAQFRARDTAPATHQSERMTDADERGFIVFVNVVKEPEERRFPGRIFADSLAEFGDAVVQARIEMTGSARSDIQPEAAVRRFRQQQAAAYVE